MSSGERDGRACIKLDVRRAQKQVIDYDAGGHHVTMTNRATVPRKSCVHLKIIESNCASLS